MSDPRAGLAAIVASLSLAVQWNDRLGLMRADMPSIGASLSQLAKPTASGLLAPSHSWLLIWDLDPSSEEFALDTEQGKQALTVALRGAIAL